MASDLITEDRAEHRSAAWLAELPTKGVLAVAGRRIDASGQQKPRFPESATAMVKARVKQILNEQRIALVVASAACGADIIALEAAVELGRSIRVILPFEQNRFRKTSVADRGGDWAERFDKLLDAANPMREVVVLAPDSGGDDAAYARATRQIIQDAKELAQAANVDPLALAIWDEQPKPDVDATRDFIDQASDAGMKLLTISTLGVQAARKYLEGGDQQPEEMLDLRAVLERSEPQLAGQLARELARRFLQGKKRMRTQAVDRLWKACKEVEAFAFARRILKRRLEGSDQIIVESYPGEPSKLVLRQQRALCTSKDPDLSAAMRHDWALQILDPDEPGLERDSEHQGIAGGIFKRRWEWDGSRGSLERSLKHYRQAIPDSGFSAGGYVEINYAFVLDLLASLMGDEHASKSYNDDATATRERLVAGLSAGDRWTCATLAEAHIGLGHLADATAVMRKFMATAPASWEVETTLRQLVRLAYLHGISASIGPVLAPAFGAATPTHQAALKSLLVGRVGLALSGGGFRASLYHLGVLARLAESDVLRHVEVLSCVSGGSIVGAQYYLCLRKQLEDRGEDLRRDDYVAIVKTVIADFVKGVERNVRTQVLSNLLDTFAIVSGNDQTYAKRVGELFHEAFYAKLDHGSQLHELLVQPKDAPDHFHPGRHNWTRRNKVPALVINAATLNTGHSWQFTARSMGESPFSIQPAVDSNPRLRRPNYRSQIANRTVYLRDAVAASACVPGLFAPMQLDELYPGYKVRLVDGGVFDNQGATSLIEQDCQVLLVSDAAGQLFSESAAQGGHVSPLLRSFNVFQERIRQSGYENLIKRKEAGQIRGMAYTHLTQGLQTPAVDWKGCEDPVQENDQVRDGAGIRSGTGDGVDREIQRYLAQIRTDLDVFNEIECAALMASGYLSIDSQLSRLLLEIPALEIPRQHESWFFSELLPVLGGQDDNPVAFQVLREHLSAAASGIGRSIMLDKRVRVVCGVLAVLLAIGCGILVYVFRAHPIATVGSATLLALGLFLPLVFGSWVGLLLDPHSIWRDPLRKFLFAIPLTVFANIILRWVDPAYLKRGRLSQLFPNRASPPQP